MSEVEKRAAGPNMLEAKVMTPELITLESGHQIVRIALRTETGTIVYAELGYGEANLYASGLARIANAARETSNRLRPPVPPEQRSRRRGL
ncbi:hypothetical protein ACSCBZ_24740 [Streptomyces niveiscabiei]|uniref:hypothetical protein n=1 Tax=Streptomyces niveiscabiei TaxID=164115 RepID=UPI0006EB7322|nr:hypothetical protein [Streptomyces niveiscabiei]